MASYSALHRQTRALALQPIINNQRSSTQPSAACPNVLLFSTKTGNESGYRNLISNFLFPSIYLHWLKSRWQNMKMCISIADADNIFRKERKIYKSRNRLKIHWLRHDIRRMFVVISRHLASYIVKVYKNSRWMVLLYPNNPPYRMIALYSRSELHCTPWIAYWFPTIVFILAGIRNVTYLFSKKNVTHYYFYGSTHCSDDFIDVNKYSVPLLFQNYYLRPHS